MKKIVGGVLFLFLIGLSLFIGVKDVTLSGVLSGDSSQQFIFWTTRIPRTVSLVLAGATISTGGLVMQHLTQNKFVSPTTAGTMDSARLGIVMVMLFLPGASLWLRSLVAFIFAFTGTVLFLAISRMLPKGNPGMLPLVGIMFGNIIGAIATFFAYQFQLIQNMTSWLQGNFATVMKGSYELLYITIPLFFLIYFFAYRFTIVGLGEDTANNLGLNYQRVQLLGMGLVAFASALVLIMVGGIPFLGVVVPNLVSLAYGDHLAKTLHLTAITGSIFLLLCDIIARIVIAPYEVPVSLVVGIIGSILFIGLLVRSYRQ